jgi:predicted acetyltransferase
MGKRCKPLLQLTEMQLRYAMENTETGNAAADWLHVDYATYRKYAKKYIDAATGKSLFELHRRKYRMKHLAKVRENDTSKRFTKRGNPVFTLVPYEDIFSGKRPTYRRDRLVERLLKDGLMVECCDNCGYNTKRNTDLASPLKLWYRNHDPDDLRLENLRLLCYNCFFILVN